MERDPFLRCEGKRCLRLTCSSCLGQKSPLFPDLTTGSRWWPTWEQKTAVERSS